VPVTYSFLGNAVWLKFSGDDLSAEFSEGVYQAIADERFVAGMHLVFDLRDYTRIPSAEDLQTRAKFLRGMRDKISSTVVILVSSDYRFGLARRFEAYAEQNGIEVEIFREKDQVIEWLKEHQKNLAITSSPNEALNRVLFIEFCEAVMSKSKGGGRLPFLKNLSEELCRHFDLPIYIPGQEGDYGTVTEFYKADLVKIVKELWGEDFDVDEVLTAYLISNDRFPEQA
jgi:hypothetical protein